VKGQIFDVFARNHAVAVSMCNNASRNWFVAYGCCERKICIDTYTRHDHDLTPAAIGILPKPKNIHHKLDDRQGSNKVQLGILEEAAKQRMKSLLVEPEVFGTWGGGDFVHIGMAETIRSCLVTYKAYHDFFLLRMFRL